EVNNSLDYTDPYYDAVNTRAKQSVTEIKRRQEIEDVYSSQDVLKPIRQPITKRPLFMQEKKELTAAEKGTAMHAVMQYLPFNHKLKKQTSTNNINVIEEKNEIGPVAEKTIYIIAIQLCVQTDAASKIINSINIEKEVPVMFTQNASTVDQDWPSYTDDNVGVQGI